MIDCEHFVQYSLPLCFESWEHEWSGLLWNIPSVVGLLLDVLQTLVTHLVLKPFSPIKKILLWFFILFIVQMKTFTPAWRWHKLHRIFRAPIIWKILQFLQEYYTNHYQIIISYLSAVFNIYICFLFKIIVYVCLYIFIKSTIKDIWAEIQFLL